MIVSHKYRFIFLRTEKTGGTSFAHAMKAVLGEGDLHPRYGARPRWGRAMPGLHGALKRRWPGTFGFHGHATAAQIRRVVGEEIWGSYLKFAVERNPWDRQLSLYTHRQWKRGRGPEHFARDMADPLYRNTQYCRMDNWSIYTIDNHVVADRVLDYASLSESLPALLTELGVPEIELPRMRAYAPDRKHYSAYYDDAARGLVARWYAREIETFGYRFEPAETTAQSDISADTSTEAARPAA